MCLLHFYVTSSGFSFSVQKNEQKVLQSASRKKTGHVTRIVSCSICAVTVPLSFLLSGTILHFTSPLVLKEEIASTPPTQPITLWKRKVF